MKFKLCKLLGVLLIASGVFASTPNREIKTQNIQIKKAIKYENKADMLTQDGTYEVPLDIHIKMNESALDHKGIIEKSGDKFYFTFTHFQNKSITNLKLISDGLVGTLVKVNGENTSYTYSLSEEDLSNKFEFTAIIAEMNKKISFHLFLKLDQVKHISPEIEDRGERPARFVPELITSASDTEVEKGSSYILPEVIGMLKTEKIDVTKEVNYLNNGSKEKVEVKNNRFLASNLGEYEVIYSASSDKYLTSLNKPTSTIFKFKVTSKLGASSNGKFVDKNNILPKGTQLQVNILKNGEIFENCKKKFATIADNYQVFEVNLYEENGNKVVLDGEIEILLKVDNYFNRNKLKIALIEDGQLSNFNLENHGRYVGFDTSKTGIYVAYIEGVAFVMPMWGYAVIAAVSLAVLIAIIITVIVVVIRKKKALRIIENEVSTSNNITSEEQSDSNKDIKKSKKEKLTRVQREEKVVNLMIDLYYKKTSKLKTEDPECIDLKSYVKLRLSKCPFQENKTFCSNCKIHCYKPEYREKIKKVMRFSGPRMIFYHPILAFKHVAETLSEKRKQKKQDKADNKSKKDNQ